MVSISDIKIPTEEEMEKRLLQRIEYSEILTLNLNRNERNIRCYD